MAASGILGTNLPEVDQYDVNKYILTPIFMGSDYMSYFELMPNIKGVTKIDHFGSAEKGTLAFNEGAFAANANLETMSAVTLSPARMEFEQEFRSAQLFGKIKGQLMKGGYEYDNVDGTIVKQILMELIMKGVKSDFNRQLWLNSDAASSVSEPYTQDANYNQYDGIFVAANGGVSLTANDVENCTDGTAISADGALSLLETMYANAPAALLEQDGLVFFVSGAVADKYQEKLEVQGSHLAFSQRVDGSPASLSFRGIPLVVRRDWDRFIVADSTNETSGSAGDGDTAIIGSQNVTSPKSNTARAILTCRGAFVVGTDFSEGNVEQWYSQDNKAFRFRISYMVGVALSNADLAVVYTPAAIS